MLLLAPTQTPLSTTDRRTVRRARATYATVFRFRTDRGRSVNGLVWDISAGGLGLLLPFAPAVGIEFGGELRTEDGRACLPTSFAVAHVRRLSTGDYFVGGKFVRPLAESDIELFALSASAEQPRPVRAGTDADAQPAGRWRK